MLLQRKHINIDGRFLAGLLCGLFILYEKSVNGKFTFLFKICVREYNVVYCVRRHWIFAKRPYLNDYSYTYTMYIDNAFYINLITCYLWGYFWRIN